MISDVSVTVSSSVVRDMEKTKAVLKRVTTMDLQYNQISNKHLGILRKAAETIERLFCWEDDMLVDEGEYELFLCRKLGWCREMFDGLHDIGIDLAEHARDLHDILERYTAGKLVDLDDLGEVRDLCYWIAESIWDHFITWHELETGMYF